MPRRKSSGCLGIIFIGAILYSCGVLSTSSPSTTSASTPNSVQAITVKENKGPKIVLPTQTSTQNLVVNMTTVVEQIAQPATAMPPENATLLNAWGVVTPMS